MNFSIHDIHDCGFPDTTRLISQVWPKPDHPCWFTYGSEDGSRGKRVCPSWESMPRICRFSLGWMALQRVDELLNLPERCIPDLMLYGAGMHDLGPGDGLGLHLDADMHAICSMRRVATSILFVVDEWCSDWGGQLQLWDASGKQVIHEIDPAPGRLVCFETTDVSWHSVAKVACPDGRTRRTLSLFWYSLQSGCTPRRPRALFVDSSSDTPVR